MTSLRGPLSDAAAAARRGELIVFPTDTVYGIGTRPDDPAATARLFEAKRRPRDLELPVLVATRRRRESWPCSTSEPSGCIGACGRDRSRSSCPEGADASGWDLGGDPATVGVRAPHHPLALALLAETGPLAVTSANRSGRPPAETCDELQALFGDRRRRLPLPGSPARRCRVDRARPRPRARERSSGTGLADP